MDLKSGYPFSLIRHGLLYQYPKLSKPVKTDVVVIGGGISGALTGYYLNNAGIDCIIVDGRSIGLGSTCASTSLLQYEIDVPLVKLSEKIGIKNALRAYVLCKESIHKLSAIAAKIDFADFKLNKSLYYAAYKKDTSFLKSEFNIRKSNGFHVQWLEEAHIEKKFGFTAPGAILSYDGAYTDAYLFTHKLHQYGIKKGLKVFDRTFIKKTRQHNKGVTLLTDDNVTINAKKIVYATGYEATELIRKKIVNLHSTYVTISDPIEKSLPLIEQNVMLWNTAEPYLYMRGTKEGRVIVGGRDEEFFDPAKRDKLIKKKSQLLTKDFHKVFPRTQFKPEFSWTGTFGSTEDGLPFIGSYPKFPHTYFALGFGGNGITFSLIAAEIIRDILLKKTNADRKLFSFDRI